MNDTTSPRRNAFERFNIPKALLDRFRAVAVPGGGKPGYHTKRGRGWPQEKWPDGNPKLLDDYSLARHLSKDGFIASARWRLDAFAQVSHAVIDLDYDGTCDADRECGGTRDGEVELILRLRDVLDALGSPPKVLVRSSTSKGLHIYLFFDRSERASDVRSVLLDRFSTAGVPVRDGYVEVYPNERPLRLPLGCGSCVLDGELPLPPIFPAVASNSGGNLVKYPEGLLLPDVPGFELLTPKTSRRGGIIEGIETFVARADAARISLDSLRLARRGSLEIGREGAEGVMRGVARGTRGPSVAGSWTGVDGLASRGQRHEQSRVLLFDLYVRQALDRADVLAQFGSWARASAERGSSKDLSSGGEVTVRAMLTDAERLIDHFDRRIAAGTLRRGLCRAFDAAIGSTLRDLRGIEHRRGAPVLAASLPISRDPRWRKAATECLGTEDEKRLAAVNDPWLRERLRVLVGLVRLQEANQENDLRRITIDKGTLHRVAGGHAPPRSARGAADPTGSVVISGSARMVLTEAAVRHGFLIRVDHGKRGKRASLFEVPRPA